MPTRRQFLGSGLAALGAGLLGRRAGAFGPPAPSCPGGFGVPLALSDPQFPVAGGAGVVDVNGVPFAPWFTGDDFPNDAIPFHLPENTFPGGIPPAHEAFVDVAVVGGGLAGLAAAYALRHRKIVVFELHPQFGGYSQGEVWDGLKYSRGGAYFITPDEGSYLESLYAELGLDTEYRLSPGGEDPAELDGQVLEDFWTNPDFPAEVQKAINTYREAVAYFAENYPEIPLPEGEDNEWIKDLDRKTFKQDVEERLGGPAPEILASAIQSYFYSSFGTGWEEISAASGWNFIAAEEFGRWVLPGGNSGMARAFWERLSVGEDPKRPCVLRGGCRVVDVRLIDSPRAYRVRVTYKDTSGLFRSVMARQVVMACPKHVAKNVIHELEALDSDKLSAMNRLAFRPYVVANVLLNAQLPNDYYDVFLLGDGVYPHSESETDFDSFVTDVLSGHFAQPTLGRSVLTMYWPLPSPAARFTLLLNDPWRHYAEALVPQVKSTLALLGGNMEDVVEVRLTRWGHAMPLALPRIIADGDAELMRRPIQNLIHFANQDNWALPAVETALLEAKWAADAVEALL